MFQPPTERAASPPTPLLTSRGSPIEGEKTEPLGPPWLAAPLLATVERDGSFSTVAGPWRHAVGWSNDELLTASLLERVHAEDIAATREALARLTAGEPIARFRLRFLSREGRWVSLHWDAHRPFDGPIFALVRDVERQRADALSQLAASLHPPTIDGAARGALDLDLRRLLELTDSTLAFVAEAHRSDGLPRTLEMLASAARGAGVGALRRLATSDLETPWGQALKTGEPTRMALGDGRGSHGYAVEASCFMALPIKMESETLGVLALARERAPFDEPLLTALAPICDALAVLIDRRRGRDRQARLEGEARRWSELFAAVTEPAGISVITTDVRGSIDTINAAAQRKLGPLQPERLRTMNLAAFHDPAELARASRELDGMHGLDAPFDALVARALERGGVDRRDWTWVSLDGVRTPMRITLSALRDRQGTLRGWAVVGAELSERHAIEAERDRAGQLEAQLALLQRKETETARLNEACEYASASRSLREALNVIGSFLPSIFGEQAPLLLVQRRGAQLDEGPAEQTPATFRAIDPRACWALKTGQLFVSEVGALRCGHLDDDHDAWICAPLADGARTLAALSARIEPPPVVRGPESEGRQRRISGLNEQARHFSSVLSNLRLRRTLEEQATRDPLTGAVNRRQLEHELKVTLHRHQKAGHPFALLVLDVDHFKQINDQHGHDRGDRVLAGLGALLRKRLRDSDVLARVGGEEFVVLLRGIDRANTARVAEFLREAIESARLAGPDTPCTCSIGALHVQRANASIEELLRRADRALYEAKSAGRNRVVFVDPDVGAAAVAPVPPSSEGARIEGALRSPR
jgi:diguanylate cyclase (GGDEF)-like protein